MSSGRLDGLVAVVTGGSRGIGAGIARDLGAAGAKVGILARDAEQAATVVEEIRAAGSDALFVAADLAREEEVAAAMGTIAGHFGALHLLVNNAALTPSRAGSAAGGGTAGGSAMDIPLDLWRRYFEVNVTGSLLASRHAIPHMRAAGYGSIVIVNSVGTRYAMVGDVGYAASKAALTGLMRSMAVDFAPQVRTNEILSGFVPNPTDNPVHRALLEKPTTRQAVIDANLTDRWGEPSDIGLACVYLCSREAGFITGQSLTIDGGAHVTMRIPHIPET